ncbi:MAG: exodeoxyribonuclease VII small subunit [Elusimicrobiales bacterium]|nr:exodeoxyribonuclease VII small subunit [Elusimicrobiaceae bacterium]MDO5765086.1 exodeoxyribonuclease VII small subunit [Elusimicrobiales bacterium]
MAPKLNFEKQLARLEEIVAKLEEEQTDLDASVKLFEEGVLLSKELSQKLETVKFKVEELKKKGTEMLTEPFDTELAENTDGE